MSAQKTVSLRDIAKVAEVSTMTVSLSLRDDPSISEPTRKKVRKIAEEMGYKRDPLLSAFGQQIRLRKSQRFHSTLAWLHDWTDSNAYQRMPWLRRYWQGARTRAEELGFAIDPLWLRQEGMDAARMNNILKARGIRGFAVHQVIQPDFFAGFPIGAYASVSIGRNLLSPLIPSVLPDATANTLMALEELHARGYRRIGYFQNVYHTTKTQAEGLATAYYHSYRITGTPPLLPFHFHDSPASNALHDFKAWIDEQQPDVILSENDLLLDMIQELKIKIPEELALVHLEITDTGRHWSGIDPHPEAIGATAIDILTSQLFRNELGSQHPHESMRIIGKWVDGDTTLNDRLRTQPSFTSNGNLPIFPSQYFKRSLIEEPQMKRPHGK